MLVDGKWVENWQPVQAKDEKGGFVRQVSSFRHWVTPDGSAGPTGEGGFKAEAGRYQLYVALICPWASRTLIGRRLKGLADVVGVTVVRFDAAYHGLFKCNLRRIADYPAISAWMHRILDIPGVRGTVNIQHIKHGYYSIKALNPTGIVPVGPELRGF